MSVLISVLLTFLVIVLCLYLLDRLRLSRRVRHIAQVIIIVIGILYLLRALGALAL